MNTMQRLGGIPHAPIILKDHGHMCRWLIMDASNLDKVRDGVNAHQHIKFYLRFLDIQGAWSNQVHSNFISR
jgi:hypothetical protein